MKPNPLPFLNEKWVGVARPTASFVGKRIIVTGSNTGIGFHAASTFAELGAAQVILAVRNTAKGMEARQKIQERAKSSVVDVWELDMQDYASIRRFASRVNELPRVDAAILNAGIVPNDYVRSPEGWESALQVNVLSTALLGLLLMPKLQQTVGSHLLIVTSEAHRWLEVSDFPVGDHPLTAVNTDENWNPLLQNARSKLLAMYVSQELACLGNSQVIVTAICPGACKSELMRDLTGKSFGQTIALKLFDLLFNKPTEQGGWSYVWATMLDEEGNNKWFKTTALTE